jgi:predicted GNAT family acetyltransferase
MSEEKVDIRDLPDKHRYVLSLDGYGVGLVTYFDEGEHRVFLHTEVRPEYGGRGLAGELVRYALDDVRGSGRRIINFCPYIRSYLEEHHDWDDVLDRPTPAILERLRG